MGRELCSRRGRGTILYVPDTMAILFWIYTKERFIINVSMGHKLCYTMYACDITPHAYKVLVQGLA